MGAIASSNNDRLLEDQENNKAHEFPEYLESESKQAQSLGGRDLLTLEAQYSHYHSSDKRKGPELGCRCSPGLLLCPELGLLSLGKRKVSLKPTIGMMSLLGSSGSFRLRQKYWFCLCTNRKREGARNKLHFPH